MKQLKQVILGLIIGAALAGCYSVDIFNEAKTTQASWNTDLSR